MESPKINPDRIEYRPIETSSFVVIQLECSCPKIEPIEFLDEVDFGRRIKLQQCCDTMEKYSLNVSYKNCRTSEFFLDFDVFISDNTSRKFSTILTNRILDIKGEMSLEECFDCLIKLLLSKVGFMCFRFLYSEIQFKLEMLSTDINDLFLIQDKTIQKAATEVNSIIYETMKECSCIDCLLTTLKMRLRAFWDVAVFDRQISQIEK
ncbi:hypothetical protein [Carp edema virus]|nr:hypothetical protein [Carp edema virus]